MLKRAEEAWSGERALLQLGGESVPVVALAPWFQQKSDLCNNFLLI